MEKLEKPLVFQLFSWIWGLRPSPAQKSQNNWKNWKNWKNLRFSNYFAENNWKNWKNLRFSIHFQKRIKFLKAAYVSVETIDFGLSHLIMSTKPVKLFESMLQSDLEFEIDQFWGGRSYEGGATIYIYIYIIYVI